MTTVRGGKRWWWLAALLPLAGGLALLGRPRGVPLVRLAARDLVQTVVASGRVLAAAEVQLRAQSSSAVIEVARDVGDVVVPGALLVQLDDREARAAREQARALLEQQSAQLYQTRRFGARSASESLRRAESARAQAARALERVALLAREGAATSSALDDARHALSLAESQRALAAIDAEAAGPAGSAARLAGAAVREAEAALLAADARLSHTRIEAPCAGVITARQVEPGDVVSLGALLFTVARQGPVRLTMEPDERNLALLAVGQPALASAEAYPDQRFAARLAFIAPSISLQRGTVMVRFDVPSPPPFLRADMTVSIETEVARRPRARVLPARAVRDAGGSAPFVLVMAEGRAVRRAVRLGLHDASFAEITAGVAAGDQVVDDPDVAPGERVRREAP